MTKRRPRRLGGLIGQCRDADWKAIGWTVRWFRFKPSAAGHPVSRNQGVAVMTMSFQV